MTTLRMAPAGEEGWRWIEAEIDLPGPASEVTLNAREVGQTYLQLDQLVFVDDPALDHPRLVGDGTSGYHGLHNVRRMAPEGRWRALWRKSDEDLGLTMAAGTSTAATTRDAGCSAKAARGAGGSRPWTATR